MQLTPIMRWLLDRGENIRRFSQSVVIKTPSNATAASLSAALQCVLDHHDTLRAKLVYQPDADWTLEIQPKGTIETGSVFSSCSETKAGFETRIRKELEAAESRLNPEIGLVIQATWITEDEGRKGVLILVLHHLVVDGFSWQILIPDLRQAWEDIASDRQPKLDPVGTSFAEWTQYLGALSLDERTVADLPLWLQTLGIQNTFRDTSLKSNRDTVATNRSLTLFLPSDATHLLLTTVPQAFHGRINDALLTAFAVAFCAWGSKLEPPTGSSVLFNLEGHGREEEFQHDLARTMGWFTILYPVRLTLKDIEIADALDGGLQMAKAFKQVKEQMRSMPHSGLSYGLLRYLNPTTAKIFGCYDELAKAQVCFNYFGRFPTSDGGDWTAAPDAPTLLGSADLDLPLTNAIELNCLVNDRQDGPELVATWTWASNLFSERKIRDLAECWFRALNSLIKCVQLPGSGGLTPSDISMVTLNQVDIEKLEAKYSDFAVK